MTNSAHNQSTSPDDKRNAEVTFPTGKFTSMSVDDDVPDAASGTECVECPMGRHIDDVARQHPHWLTELSTAIFAPLAGTGLALLFFTGRGPKAKVPDDPYIIAVCAIFGAVCEAFVLMDIAKARSANKKSVGVPLRLLFGFGLWSLLLVWVPAVIASVIAMIWLRSFGN